MNRVELLEALGDWLRADQNNRVVFAVMSDEEEKNGLGAACGGEAGHIASAVGNALHESKDRHLTYAVFSGALAVFKEQIGNGATIRLLNDIIEHIKSEEA